MTVTKKDHSGSVSTIRHTASDRMMIRGIPRVFFVRSERNEVLIEGAGDEVAKVRVASNGGRQTIEYPGGNSKDPDLLVTVYTTEVKELEADALGSLQLEPVLDIRKARLNLRGVGSVKLEFSGGAVDGSLSAVGRAELSGKLDEGELRFSAIAVLDLDRLSRGQTQVRMNSIASSR